MSYSNITIHVLFMSCSHCHVLFKILNKKIESHVILNYGPVLMILKNTIIWCFEFYVGN